jgi:hypothetical protein
MEPEDQFRGRMWLVLVAIGVIAFIIWIMI